MKIAIIGSRGYPYVYSGYETFVKELSERLIKNNIGVTVYCHKNLFRTFPQQLNGIDLTYLPTIERKVLSQFVHSLQAILHACFHGFDIILVVNSANGVFGIFTRLFGKKTAINVDGLEWLRPKWKGLGARYFYFSSKMATKLYDEIITDSFEMQKVYENEFHAHSTVIAYGANIRYSNDPSLIAKYDLQKNEYYLIVGRLIPDNNADVIVREFLQSTSRKKLVIVGDVPYNDAYAEKIKTSVDPRVVFTGYITDQDTLAELYHNCFVYFHGHEFGGTNPALLKGLAYGCAVIALDTVFNREMLEQGKYGKYFSKNAGDLHALIESIEQHPFDLEIFRAISRERITANYTWEKITSQYMDLFNTMLNTREKRL